MTTRLPTGDFTKGDIGKSDDGDDATTSRTDDVNSWAGRFSYAAKK